MTTKQVNFESFALHEGIMQALKEADFITPSSIQQEAIPLILQGKDLIGQAQTGTGKTGAFGLPTLHLLQQNPGSQMLILAPTRELAKQISDEIYRFGRHLGIKTAMICGGKSFKNQIDSVHKGMQVVVATPGRILDLLQSQRLPYLKPSIVVLDEADEMLDMGFLEDITQIFQFLPEKRQTLLFSATMPIGIKRLAEKILRNPLYVRAKQTEQVNQDIEQFYYMVREDERDWALVRLIEEQNPEKAIIFCRTKKDVDRLTHFFVDAGYPTRGLHGDMEQPQREEVMRNFRSDKVQLLVATDVAARGISITNISHVFNYHLPFDPHGYLHRIGRTGRAGKKGIAGTLLTSREWRDFQRFEKTLGTKIIRAEVPSLAQIKTSKRHGLVNKILSQGIHEEAEHLLNLLGSVDQNTMGLKLISILLGQQFLMGPEHIGLEKKEGGVKKPTSAPFPPRNRKRNSRQYS